MGSRVMFICWFGFDVIVELRIWSDLCGKLNMGCGILRDSFMHSME